MASAVMTRYWESSATSYRNHEAPVVRNCFLLLKENELNPYYEPDTDEGFEDDFDLGELEFDDDNDRSHVQCFCTTIAIDTSSCSCLIVTGVLLDSGASAHHISRRVVDELGLKTYRCGPVTFDLADGSKAVQDEMTYVDVWMGGVKVNIRAFVDDSASNLLMLIGHPAKFEFRLRSEPVGVGPKCMEKVTVAWDETGMRATRFVVPCDPDGEATDMFIVDTTEEEALAARQGETSSDHDIRVRLDHSRTEWRDRIQHLTSTAHLSYFSQLGRNYRLRPS